MEITQHTERHEMFAAHFARTLDLERAAELTGITEAEAKEWLKDTGIQNRIDLIGAELVAEEEQDRKAPALVKLPALVATLKAIATLDIGQAHDETGRHNPIRAMSDGVRTAIASITCEEVYGLGSIVRSCTYWAKGAALEPLARTIPGFLKEHLIVIDQRAPEENTIISRLASLSEVADRLQQGDESLMRWPGITGITLEGTYTVEDGEVKQLEAE